MSRRSRASPASTASAAPASSEARTYQLLIEVARPLRVRVGALGPVSFASGQYVYTGSARRNLEARIARHLGAQQRLHWHIDYLLTCDGVRILGVRRFADAECEVNAATHGSTIARFGASDCRARCGAHLKRLLRPARPDRWSPR